MKRYQVPLVEYENMNIQVQTILIFYFQIILYLIKYIIIYIVLNNIFYYFLILFFFFFASFFVLFFYLFIHLNFGLKSLKYINDYQL